MDYSHAIQIIKKISEESSTESQSSALASSILTHIQEHGGSMMVMNLLNTESVIKVAYASEMSAVGFPFAYGRVIDLYDWMMEARGGTYVIRLKSNLVSLPTKEIVTYSDVLPYVDGFLEMELAISGSKLDVNLIHDVLSTLT